jgi:hypothetical protein
MGEAAAMLKWLRDLIDLLRPVGRKSHYVEWRSPGGNYCWFSFGFDPNKTEGVQRDIAQYAIGWTKTGKVSRNHPRAG